MFSRQTWDAIQNHLASARKARQAGNEGRARVSARLAAAEAVRAYIQQQEPLLALPRLSAHDLLSWLRDQPDAPRVARQAAAALTWRVDTHFNLPADMDLLVEAQKLIDLLEQEQKMTDKDEIVIYGTSWCGHSRRSRGIFDQNGIAYRWVDIDQDMEGRKFVESVNHGNRSVPTILFPDGTTLTEPSDMALRTKLGLSG
ncbi:MAG TPA: glutaredoxin domain-containing protein [Anaerolineaceae bacterium]|jgi:mycoredoxin|nr:glutaredoxin domain-containing protein [Anaerolineaceae bacterium]